MTTLDYQAFLQTKRALVAPAGFHVALDDLNPHLFDWQRKVVQWALRVGRAALFVTTGLGKTLMQLAYAEQVLQREPLWRGQPSMGLILAPLAVSHQTKREGEKFGVPVTVARTQADCRPGVNIGNYERFLRGHYDASKFIFIILDESGILANWTGETKRALIPAFRETPYRLVCSATPAPNQTVELCNQADFLGVMTNNEMLSKFFTPKGAENSASGNYRLKPYARLDFYRWLSSWAMSANLPSDLGFPNDGYILPPLTIKPTFIDTDWAPKGQLFLTHLKGVTERAQVRKDTFTERVEAVAALIAAEPDERWLVWYGLMKEVDLLAKLVPEAVTVRGSDTDERKEKALLDFADGRTRVLVTHPKIAGLGMNMQVCARIAFIGLDDSFSTYFQAIRRCWRFGQTRGVDAHIVLAEPQRAVYENVLRKEREALDWSTELINSVRDFERAELEGKRDVSDIYDPVERLTSPEWLPLRQEALCLNQSQGKDWLMVNGDSCEVMAGIPTHSVGLTVTSIPFQSTYIYSPSARDMGNVKDGPEFWQQMEWVSRELLRVMKPGRLVCLHVANLPRYANRDEDGESGRFDFRGDTIRHFESAGFVYHSEVTIWKNAQRQAIANHSKGLLFVQLKRDSAAMWQAWADYLVVMRTPGKNEEPINNTVIDEDTWIKWASPVWDDIRETSTLDGNQGRTLYKDPDSDKHLCPLQVPFIERCVKLWSNPGDIVFDPFGGIGSTPVVGVRHGRKGLGIELNPNYFKQSLGYLRDAEASANQPDLFGFAGVTIDPPPTETESPEMAALTVPF